MSSKLVKIALAGEGGQGVQSVAEIIAEAANQAGREALYIPNFGVEQRGGVSIAFLQIDDEKIAAPKFVKGDIVVALSDRAVVRTQQYVGPNTLFVYDTSIEEVEEYLPKNAKKVMGIPALEISKNELHPRVFNILIMGAVIGATGVVTLEQAKNAIEKKLGYKFEQNPKLRDLNFAALEKGYALAQQA
ncbi:MAG: 2-oxoacid:acceptor oxidoreductase family protein [Bacillota bacterium]|uniref:2-oxoglutarate ferredoxin oxidoreductase subunit gamma n=2 Tax=Carboxydocella TaxID=178898 RepID=A0A1T4MG22_9FIRM|nr:MULTISPECIES: 2-oxoacid:acceptor oxidoreductase family protein [Carboxydocella]AVX21315.1 2-oxoglutarate ferredoxin oxidoreductase subunit gamma [Carboxydocella thermautotrophica]AVX31746.1 2-oxoglutarate ferredoxin oxidoreductase subunit gamma [Carboxydocella thermautotrophica]SJZ65796.1 2-oxoglutarate ferredoxin oxidoreductase subunit gamma [Carboxydocella sporoproducens DSM 16521]GAW29359.1 pyruvate/ketoisovalerate oxidoreductase subunit gamma [Carboxydocella sp. ULO1]GAW30633.1 pyruvate